MFDTDVSISRIREHENYVEVLVDSVLAINSSIDDWFSVCHTPENAERAEVEPVGAGYLCSSASRHFEKMLIDISYAQRQKNKTNLLRSIWSTA
jgi:hypothetical protein